jgi:phospholipid transport system transporter-binding protein
MDTLEINFQNQTQVVIKGDLTFARIDKHTVKAINFKSLNINQLITIDLNAVTSSDSAGLALIIEWIKHSKASHTPLKFSHIPAQLLNLARLSGFEHNDYFLT